MRLAPPAVNELPKSHRPKRPKTRVGASSQAGNTASGARLSPDSPQTTGNRVLSLLNLISPPTRRAADTRPDFATNSVTNINLSVMRAQVAVVAYLSLSIALFYGPAAARNPVDTWGQCCYNGQGRNRGEVPIKGPDTGQYIPVELPMNCQCSDAAPRYYSNGEVITSCLDAKKQGKCWYVQARTHPHSPAHPLTRSPAHPLTRSLAPRSLTRSKG